MRGDEIEVVRGPWLTRLEWALALFPPWLWAWGAYASYVLVRGRSRPVTLCRHVAAQRRVLFVNLLVYAVLGLVGGPWMLATTLVLAVFVVLAPSPATYARMVESCTLAQDDGG